VAVVENAAFAACNFTPKNRVKPARACSRIFCDWRGGARRTAAARRARERRDELGAPNYSGLDTDGSRVVKGVQFIHLRDAGDPAELAARYNREGADELVVLDIAASRDHRPTFLETIRRVAAELAIPLSAGGGIGTLEEGQAILRAGADKVTVNTAAIRRPALPH